MVENDMTPREGSIKIEKDTMTVNNTFNVERV